MAGINQTPSISYIDLYSSFTELPSGYSLGALEFGNNGKAFRLVKAGASALVVGNTLQSSAVDTQFTDMAMAAAAAKGATQISVTNGTTTINANDFDGGSVMVSVNSSSGTNLGDEYTIMGHTAPVTNGNTVVLYLDRPIRTALTLATTKVTMSRSPWSGVIQSTGGSATGTPAGVAIFAIPASSFGWVQTKGVASVLSDNSTFAVGSLVGPSVAVAGACGVFVAGTARTFIGMSMVAADSTKTIPVQLMLD